MRRFFNIIAHDVLSFDKKWFFTMVLLAALPALVNGYPFYFEDSAGYDGHGMFLPSTGERFNLGADVPGSISSALYPFAGVWSLIILNVITFAYLISRFAYLYLKNTPISIGVLVIGLSGAPFYASLLCPDIWIVFLGLCFVMLLARFSWIELMLAVVAASGHGSGIYILIAASLIFVILGHKKIRCAVLTSAICASSVLVVYFVDLWIDGAISTEKPAQATIASKIMNDVPEALVDYCIHYPEEKICGLKDRVEALKPHNPYDDAQYLWHARLRDEPGTLSWHQFNELGVNLLAYVLLSPHITAYLTESFYDYLNFYNDSRCLGFSGFVVTAADDWTLAHYAEGEGNSLARSGAFDSETNFCKVVYVSTFLVSVVGSLVFIIVFFAYRNSPLYDIVLSLYSIALSNDVFFALFSGGYTRYHLRALSLVALVILIACDAYFQQRAEGPRSRQKVRQ